LSKWFEEFQIIEDIPYQLHKELVNGIRKLMFLFGKALLVDNSHPGIKIMTVSLLTVQEEDQLRVN